MRNEARRRAGIKEEKERRRNSGEATSRRTREERQRQTERYLNEKMAGSDRMVPIMVIVF